MPNKKLESEQRGGMKMPTYGYTDNQESTITFDAKTNPQKITINGINGELNNPDRTAKAIRGYMYLGGVSMFNEYDPTEAIQTLKKGFVEIS